MDCGLGSYAGDLEHGKHWTNYSGRVERTIRAYWRPHDLSSLVTAVCEATESGGEIHAVGRGWAYEDLAVSWDNVISLEHLDNPDLHMVLASDAVRPEWSASRLVHVEAGIEIGELNLHLRRHRLDMPTLGGANGQSIAGAIATSTHGGDIDFPPLCDLVRAVQLVGVGGQVFWIERKNRPLTREPEIDICLPGTKVIRDDELFSAVLVSAGRFGVIYSLVLEVVDMFDLAEWTCKGATADVLATLRGSAGDPSPLAHLLASLPKPNSNVQLGLVPDTSPVHFLSININSVDTSECYVVRRWRTPVDPTKMLGPYVPPGICTKTRASDILHCAAKILYAQAAHMALVLLLAPLGAVVAARAASLVAAADRGIRGGEALRLAAEALWDWGFSVFLSHASREAFDANYKLSMESGRQGISHLVTSNSREQNHDECYRGDSAEYIFSASTPAYLDFIEEIADRSPAARHFRQLGYISLRFCAPSEALLSMHHLAGKSVVSIEVSSLLGLSGNDEWYEFVESRALRHGGRPHWGQRNTIDSAQVADLYGDSYERWKATLTTFSGTSTTFSNAFTRKRGLEPYGLRRLVTRADRTPNGVVTHIYGPGYEPVPTARAIDDILTGSVSYYVNGDDDDVEIHVVTNDDGKAAYLRTSADESMLNNLDSLPAIASLL